MSPGGVVCTQHRSVPHIGRRHALSQSCCSAQASENDSEGPYTGSIPIPNADKIPGWWNCIHSEPIGCNDVRLEDFSTDYYLMWSISRHVLRRCRDPQSDHPQHGGSGDNCISVKSGRGMEVTR